MSASYNMLSANELSSVFSDMTPIAQDDRANPVCVIDYTAEFTKAYDYMRAVLAASEKSERALGLTALCLKLNPANYTIWHYRRECLKALGDAETSSTIAKDLELASKLGGSNPKNYQIWYHRRALLEPALTERPTGFMDLANVELDYLATVLDNDGKNYHAWSYRQWIIRTVNDEDLWNREMQFVNNLIHEDPRNNSAWNQRWFASHRGSRESLQLAEAHNEANYAIQGAKLDPYNESPWRYLIGIAKEQVRNSPSEVGIDFLTEYERKSLELRTVLLNAERDPEGCTSLVSARIDLLELAGDRKSLEMATDLANGLATEHDTIRKKYWSSRKLQLEQRKDAL